MRNTRENVIKLMEKSIERSWRIVRDENVDQNVRDFEKHTAMALQSAIWLLKDLKYFNEIYEIYKDDLE